MGIKMIDLGENPLATMLYAVWDFAKWWIIIALTWFGGLCFGFCVGGFIGYLGWNWLSYIGVIGYWSVLPGIGITVAASSLPMAFDSRKIEIGAAIANFTVWMLIGASISMNTSW
jgi:hypothetical protein